MNEEAKLSEVTIEYKIVGIRPCPYKSGNVEVTFEPTKPLELDDEFENGIMVGPNIQIPPELKASMKALKQMMVGQRRDPRTIVQIFDEIEFEKEGWKYGDIVDITIAKKDMVME